MPKKRRFRRALPVVAGVLFVVLAVLIPGLAAAVGALGAVVGALAALRQREAPRIDATGGDRSPGDQRAPGS